MTEIINQIKQALADVGTLPWEYIELGRNIEHDAIRNANGYTILGISSYMQENVDFLLLAVNNISSLITTIESQKEEIEKLRNYLETLRSNTPYGLYQQQITEVLQDAEEWPCTCGNCDGEHFGMAINRRTENEQT